MVLRAARDTEALPIRNSSASVTLSIKPPAGSANLTCTTNPQAATSGVATFAGCQIDKTAYFNLTAATSGLASSDSASFHITP